MLSILVCHSYFLRFDPKQVERAKPYPPLATLQVAALLRRAGHSVALFDAMLADGVPDFTSALGAAAPQLVVLYEDNYNYLSKMCLGRMREAACEMIGLSRAAGARVIAAGSDVTDAPEHYLHAGADLALLGEGLPPLLRAVAKLDASIHVPGAALVDGCNGVAALVDGRAVVHRGAAPPVGLEAELLPAWDLVHIERYRAVWQRAHGRFSLNMAASRGCSFRCSWCAKPIWGNRYLQREPRAVAAEMLDLKQRFAVDHVWFADDIFGLRWDWVETLADALQAGGGGVPFTIQTRADLISERMARALARAGCGEAWIGAESGSQRVLDAMNKGTTVGEVLTARERLKAAGIRVGFFIQLGYLDEDLPDILATRDLLERARPDDVGVSVAYPLPGTVFHDIVKRQLREQARWSDSDELAMMFEGTYETEFYRTVRTLLHDEVARGESDAARTDLHRRWEALLSDEPKYRRATQ